MTARELFVAWALAQRGKPVVMGAKGDYLYSAGKLTRLPPETAFDCSGLVTSALRAVGVADLRDTHNAQRLYSETPPTAQPEPGDLGFYGRNLEHVDHVVIYLPGGHLLSADGATHTITTLGAAMADLHCRVAYHSSVLYRRDELFLGWRTNTLLSSPIVLPYP